MTKHYHPADAMMDAANVGRKHPMVQAQRYATQFNHGDRVEERQRVNGQPNGYSPISEAELQALRAGRAC
jgi:hypothetical protein